MIIALTTINGPVSNIKIDQVITVTCHQRIGPSPASEGVITGITIELIITLAAG